MVDPTVHFFLSRATTRCGRIVVHEAMYVIWPDQSFEGEPCLECFAWQYMLEHRLLNLRHASKTIDYFTAYGGIETTFVYGSPIGRLSSGARPNLQR